MFSISWHHLAVNFDRRYARTPITMKPTNNFHIIVTIKIHDIVSKYDRIFTRRRNKRIQCVTYLISKSNVSKFSLILLGVTLFGITMLFLCVWNRINICAGVLLYFFAISTRRGSSSNDGSSGLALLVEKVSVSGWSPERVSQVRQM